PRRRFPGGGAGPHLRRRGPRPHPLRHHADQADRRGPQADQRPPPAPGRGRARRRHRRDARLHRVHGALEDGGISLVRSHLGRPRRGLPHRVPLAIRVRLGGAPRRAGRGGGDRPQGDQGNERDRPMSTIGLPHFLVVGAALFALGMVTVVTRRNAVGILMGVELILNAANVNFIAFNHSVQGPGRLTGQFFPLLGTALNTAFGPRLQKLYGKRAVHIVAIGAMVLSCLVAEVAFWKMLATPEHERFFEDHLWTMWQSGVLKVDLSFGVDPLGMVMTMIVTHVATLIHIYSTGYMADEPAYWRFFLWLNLFVFSMLLLVMGSNF